MTISLSAHYDGKSIVLDDDYPLTPQTKLLVTVIADDDEDARQAERRAWSTHSQRSMSRVFGDNEPEYSAADAIP